MQFKIPKLIVVSQNEFIGFWSTQYAYPHRELYENNIGMPLTEERIRELFLWKNGVRNLSDKKNDSVDKIYISQLDHLPDIKTVEEGKEYISKLGGGAIWGIFWLHCLNPKLFPIFDQHTYRAMADIEDLNEREIPNSKKRVIDIYFSKYMPFVLSLSDDWRTADKALFQYGKVLKMPLFGMLGEH